jgi:hypothetical protein
LSSRIHVQSGPSIMRRFVRTGARSTRACRRRRRLCARRRHRADRRATLRTEG